MSNELDEVARALFNGQIPSIWRKLAPDTLKSLGNWMEHFKRRYDQYTGWVGEGEPAVMWLSGGRNENQQLSSINLRLMCTSALMTI